MRAVLVGDVSLTLIFTNLSSTDSVTGHQPVWFYGDNAGWLTGEYNESNNTQKFTASQQGIYDLQIVFMSFGIHGLCRIDFYENSPVITRSRYLKWK